MRFRRWLVVSFFRFLTSLVCRIDDDQLSRVPGRGPLVIVMNHVNILEVPIIFTRLYPRPVTGFVRDDAWDNPLWRFALDACGAIPIRRGEADLSAVRTGLDLLKRGHVLIIAPEGTRSHDGQLQKAHPGVVLLALRSGCPMMPVVYSGSEGFRENLRRLRRTDFHICVGESFYLDPRGERVTRQVRRRMVDEVMYRLAALLPPECRGAYSDLGLARDEYLSSVPT